MKTTARLFIELSIMLCSWLLAYLLLSLLLSDYISPEGSIEIQIHDTAFSLKLFHLSLFGFFHISVIVYGVRSLYTRFRSRSISVLFTLFSALSLWLTYSIEFIYRHAILFYKINALDYRLRNSGTDTMNPDVMENIKNEISDFESDATFLIFLSRILFYLLVAAGTYLSIKAIMNKKKIQP